MEEKKLEKLENINKYIIVILPIIFFCVLAILVKTNILSSLENNLYTEMVEHRNVFFTILFEIFTWVGDPVSIIIICLTALIYSKTRKKLGYPLVITIGGATILNYILKEIFARERPNFLRIIEETHYSFPSAHAMVSAAIYTMCILVLNHEVKSKKIRIIGTAVGIFIPFMIGLSRVYLGVHYISDVIGGFLLGFALSFFIYDKYKNQK